MDVENVFQKEKYRIILQIKSVKCELQGLNDIGAKNMAGWVTKYFKYKYFKKKKMVLG